MNFEELTQEVAERGFDYVRPTRREAFVNRSYRRLCARYPWPFLEETASGTAPLTITDLRHVLSVTDATNDELLAYADGRRLRLLDATLSEESTPEYFYLEGSQLRVYPTASVELSVRYVKGPEDLSGSETPLVPSDFHQLIVDGAVVYCLKDNDELSEARELEADVDRQTTEMCHALMGRNYQGSETITRSGLIGDYL